MATRDEPTPENEARADDAAAAAVPDATRAGASGAAAAGRWERYKLARAFWVFLLVTCFFNVGQFVFVLLYNLYLLDRGFGEDFLGLVASLTTAGNVAGTLLAVAVNRRLGLRRTVMICFACGAVVSAARSLAGGEAALLSLAFLAGTFFAVWAISIAVVVAQVTTREQRTLAFSIYLATAIGIGVFADLLGGRLPAWIGGAFGAQSPAESKQYALLCASVLIALAVWPVSRLRLRPTQAEARATYPRGPFVLRFLAAVAVMTVATTAFNPFANAYFSRHLRMPVEEIGLVFSAGQLAQVAAILLSPLILRRLGIVWGVACMEAAAALSLLFLSTGPHAAAAAAGYAGFVAFQWMDEPAMESLLMTRVRPHERSGASSLMYLVIFASSAAAAPLAGYALARVGYGPVMATASALLLAGGLMFGLLLRNFRDEGDEARDAATPRADAPRLDDARLGAS